MAQSRLDKVSHWASAGSADAAHTMSILARSHGPSRTATTLVPLIRIEVG
jgi:hypothetical protein